MSLPVQEMLPGVPPTQAQLTEYAMGQPLDEKIRLAIATLQEYENVALQMNPTGYWLAFSGGKDSVAILDLARRAGVKHRAVYSVTTIDPPELVRFIKHEHPGVEWNRPAAPFFRRVTSVKGPPTRTKRWCCEEYKEHGGDGWAKIIGVRAAESPRRAATWKTIVANRRGSAIVCPIVYWTTVDVWDYIRARKLPYCGLYDEGFSRLGCVGCPLAGTKAVAAEFLRWPALGRAWKRAVVRHWELWHEVPTRRGTVRYSARFSTGESYWRWWLSGESRAAQDAADCQLRLLYV